MPDWYKLERAVPARAARREAIVEAVEKDQRELFYPSNVRLLRIVQGMRPPLADAMLRRIMRPERRAVTLPLKPPIKPQLARARESCPRATTGATSRSGTASARSSSATATRCTCRAATASR